MTEAPPFKMASIAELMALEHSIFAPSSGARAVQCPGSVTMELRFPETEVDPDAAEGIAAHWAFSKMVFGEIVEIGTRAPNGILLTEEMLDGAQMMVDDVHQVMRENGLTSYEGVHVEERIAIPRVHNLCFGTPDCWLAFMKDGRIKLFVWDFKFGRRFVSEYENQQLVDYQTGIVDRLGSNDQIVDVSLRVVQPRCYLANPVREWTVPAVNLRAQINTRANKAAEALTDDPKLQPGVECRDCKARHACPALHQTGHHVMDVTLGAWPKGLPKEVLGWEMAELDRCIEILKAMRTGIEQQAFSMIRGGQDVPGVRVKPGEGREVWKVPASLVINTGKMMGIDVTKPQAAITPKQAIAKGLHPDIVKGFATHNPGEMKVVVDDGSFARRLFAKHD